jgi:enoyl-CoA hydratase/carnithine racemase
MSEAVNQGHVNYSVNELGIATIEFGHPLSNSLPGKILRKLAETITAAGNDSNAKVIILRSVGEKAFCAGASFDELISIKETLSKLPITSLTMDERGFTKKIQTKSRETRILNNRFGN